MKSLLILLSLILASNQETENCIVSLFPEENPFIGITGLNYLYFCQGWNIEDNVVASWYINNTVYSNGLIDNIIIDSAPGVSTLAILNIKTDFNGTEITCFVSYSDGRGCYTFTSTFLVQGILPPVSSIDLSLNISCSSNGTILLNWDSSFTLDLSNIDDDIVYNVEIQSSDYSLMPVRVSDNSYAAAIPNYNSDNASCSLFNITVTPFNLAGFGNSTVITESAFDSVDSININVIQGRYISSDQVMYTLYSNPAICNVEMVVLRDMNYDTNVILDENNINVTNDCSTESIILINSEGSNINFNRHYNASYHLVNTNRTCPTNIINTYDIQNITIDNANRTLKFRLLEDSMAMGALLIVCPLNFNNLYFIFVPLDREAIVEYSIPSYMLDSLLLAFDIEDEGIVMPGINYPASDQLYIPGTQDIIEKSISTKIEHCFVTLGMEVFVTPSCICEQLSTTEAYQVFLLHHSDTNVKLYANNSNCYTGATIEVEKNGTYFVAAFAIENYAGITTSSKQFSGRIVIGGKTQASDIYVIIGATIGTILSIILIFIVIAVITTRLYKKHHKSAEIIVTNDSCVDSTKSSFLKASVEEEEDSEVQHVTEYIGSNETTGKDIAASDRK